MILFFNFRDCEHALGITTRDTTLNWRVGQMLLKWAGKRGVSPARLLADKTDPNPTVAARHVIAHYPMELFKDACAFLGAAFEEERRQLKLF